LSASAKALALVEAKHVSESGMCEYRHPFSLSGGKRSQGDNIGDCLR